MKDRKILLAAVAALACSIAAFLVLHRQAREVAGRSAIVPVLVARQYLPAHSTLTRERVEVRRIPESFASPGAVADLSALEGLVSLAPISAGEQIQSNKFARSGSSLAGFLEPGERAYTLDVSDSQGVGGLLRSGHRVDLLARYDSGTRRLTAFALQDVRVLAVGRSTAPEAKEEEGSTYSHVTLALTPEQAETLAFLEDRAALKLVLRAEGDEGVVNLAPLGEPEVLSRLGRAPVRGRRIEVIRGSSDPNDEGGMP